MISRGRLSSLIHRRKFKLFLSLLAFSVLMSALAANVLAQIKSPAAKSAQEPSPLEHYQVAQTFSIAGNADRASAEYKLFLAEAFRQMANAKTHEGNFSAAFVMFDEAVQLNPDSPEIRTAYGTALELDDQTDKAIEQAKKAVGLAPKDTDARYLLARALFHNADYKGAKEHLEAAAGQMQGNLTFPVGYWLALTYLKLADVNRASLLFDEMQIGFGDSPALHVYFGHAYLITGNFDRAITELKRALAKDARVKNAHYLLGVAYLSRDEDKGWDENASEDRAEIQNNPDDFRPHYDLGKIAVHLHQNEEAERELRRAAEIQPNNPDPLIALGELLISERRLPDAEAAMTKAIALTKDPSRERYQIYRAYYVLGRIQIETGRREQGVQNLKTAAELREKTEPQKGMGGNGSESTAETARKNVASVQPMGPPDDVASSISPETQKRLDAYFDQLKPAIADAYNNLGVAAGAHNDFSTAIAYFHKAQQWYPQLQTLDRNLGMSAFHAGQYQDAVLPLWHVLQRDPNDKRVRAALALSYFSVQNFEGTVETLRPIQKDVAADPGTGTALAVSLIKTGQYEQGMALLNTLQKANPNLAEIHAAIGETYADQGIYAKAIEEFRKALAIDASQTRTRYLLGVALIRDGKPAEAVPELRAALSSNPQDAPTKYHLALALLQSQMKDEAQSLLAQVIQQDRRYADAYYQLGKLELESGDAKQAISNLESAAALSPRSDYIHYQLSLAYGRDSRADDAQREMQLYQALKTERRGDHEQSRSD